MSSSPVGKTFVAIMTVSLVLGSCLSWFRCVYEARSVAGTGMQPIFELQDSVLVNKTSYVHDKPKRGDIILFKSTSTMQKQDFQGDFLKRIVGLPGERFGYKDGHVYINQRFLEEPYLAKNSQGATNACKASAKRRFAKDVTIPLDSYIVLGDNRGESYDSRCWGFIPESVILGQAKSIFLPFNRIRWIDQLK